MIPISMFYLSLSFVKNNFVSYTIIVENLLFWMSEGICYMKYELYL